MVIKLIIFICIVWLLIKVVKKIMIPAGDKESFRNFSDKRSRGNIEEMIQDPCCGKYIPANKAIRMNINGKELFFCCMQCADSYKKNECNI